MLSEQTHGWTIEMEVEDELVQSTITEGNYPWHSYNLQLSACIILCEDFMG